MPRLAVRILPAAVLAFAALPVVGADFPPADETALRALADAADLAWNARDASALAALYTRDASLRLGGRAVVVEGADAVRDYFNRSFARADAALRHATTVDAVQRLDDDVALVDTSVQLLRVTEGGASEVVREFDTLTLAVREDGGWKLGGVRAFPRAAPAPAPQAASAALGPVPRAP